MSEIKLEQVSRESESCMGCYFDIDIEGYLGCGLNHQYIEEHNDCKHMGIWTVKEEVKNDNNR